MPTFAALKPGDLAPDFTAQASLGGTVFTFSLAEALKKGPVVLYFQPAAFTTGCTIKAHDFADATDTYRALGATVIAVWHDNIDPLNKFSVSECRSKFAVAADGDRSIMKSYDAVLAIKPEYADRFVRHCARWTHYLCLPVAQPREACRELSRRVAEMGFHAAEALALR